MLSRVANRLYWSARYLERTEGVARMISSYSQFILDTPKSANVGWDVLIRIIEREEQYFSRYSKISENNVIKFLLSDEENLGSIQASVKYARENMRTTRDVLPEQAWELVNELKIFVDSKVENAVVRKNRYDFLQEVMLQNMQIDGLFDGSMNRDRSFEFIRLGRYLERCDITTRIADVGIAGLPDEDEALPALEVALWSNMLTSLSATSAYRRQIGPIVEPAEVIDFIFNYADFPRSIRYCLERVERVLARFSDNNDSMAILGRIQKKLDKFKAKRRNKAQVHQLIDEIQIELNRLNTTISDTWFFPENK